MQTKVKLRHAFTAVELIVIIALITILAALLLPALSRNHQNSLRTQCANNLKQIDTAYRVWSSDSMGGYPTFYSKARGGWRDYIDQTNAGQYCWTNYVIMQKGLGKSPFILTCPADERFPANDFNHITNTNLSYFVAADGNESFPNCTLGGDRNLSPGLTGKNDYGFSKPNGEGNDVWIKTNSTTDPICWSLKMHSFGDPAGAGNLLLGDGSVQQASSAILRNFQTNAAIATGLEPDELHKTSFRLIFP